MKLTKNRVPIKTAEIKVKMILKKVIRAINLAGLASINLKKVMDLKGNMSEVHTKQRDRLNSSKKRNHSMVTTMEQREAWMNCPFLSRNHIKI